VTYKIWTRETDHIGVPFQFVYEAQNTTENESLKKIIYEIIRM
jgi:hypothetical protein